MKSQMQQLCATLGATFLLTACVPDKIDVNVNITSPQPPTPEGPGGSAAPAVATEPRCTKNFTVRDSTDGHLVNTQEVKITGPYNDGGYRLHPTLNAGKPAHQLLTQPHPLLVSSQDGTMYTGVFDVKSQVHGAAVSRHFYTVTMEFDASGCPFRLTFDIQSDTGANGSSDHGGHGVAD